LLKASFITEVFAVSQLNNQDQAKANLLAGEEIKNITQHAAICTINFSVSTSFTGYRSKSFALNIKNFCQVTARGPELIC